MPPKKKADPLGDLPEEVQTLWKEKTAAEEKKGPSNYEEWEAERWKKVADEELERRRAAGLADYEVEVESRWGWQAMAALKDASPEQRSDRAIVLEAVSFNGWALQWASEHLLKDREIVLAAVKSNGLVLELASENLRNDKKLVLEAVKQNGRALKWASPKLTKDADIVMAAVLQCGHALAYAADELRGQQRFWVSPDALKGARLL
mmetsp:Transcript_95568/g.212557  ORF Transcript_95568/g.212557 Transcript_95568/m.212557 type:complete len:206 (+) Transcript_95568:111-728(+)